MIPKQPTPGRILALDLGEKRLGVALSDERRIVARPFVVLKRHSRAADFARLARIIQEQQVTLLLVGLPVGLTTAGESTEPENARVAWMRDYATELSAAVDLPLIFCDESYSTVEAAASLHARGQSARQQRQRIDAVAAAIFLQAYLDASASAAAFVHEP